MGNERLKNASLLQAYVIWPFHNAATALGRHNLNLNLPNLTYDLALAY